MPRIGHPGGNHGTDDQGRLIDPEGKDGHCHDHHHGHRSKCEEVGDHTHGRHGQLDLPYRKGVQMGGHSHDLEPVPYDRPEGLTP
jgi:hypothetical protein